MVNDEWQRVLCSEMSVYKRDATSELTNSVTSK
jgi:hypothetical protein